MKAIVLHAYGGVENLHYEEVPDAVAGPDDLLIRSEATSINPLDYKLRSGAMAAVMPLQFPFIPGLEFAGIVTAVGKDVRGFVPGDRVFGRARSTYAELCTVRAAEAVLIPDGLDTAKAAALPVVLLTGEQIVRLGAKVAAGQTVLVAGAIGGVGRSAIYTAKKLGAHVIAGVRGKQMEEGATLGADEVIALDDESALANLLLLDAVVDLVGRATAEVLLTKVKPGGKFATSVGAAPQNAAQYPDVQVQAIQVVSDNDTLEAYAKAVVAGRFDIPIDRKIPLVDAAAGQAAVERGGIGKVVLLT